MKKCINCGAKLSDDAKFCDYCGDEQPVQQAPAPAANLQQTQPVQSTQPIVINNIITPQNDNPPVPSANTAPQYNAAAYQTPINVSNKSKNVDLVLCIFLGYFGIHKFYEGKIFWGIVYFFTYGICGIGWIVDIIRIACGAATDKQGRKIIN